MEVRSRQEAKSVCIKRRHGAMSAGEVLEEDCFVCYVKAVALFDLRGRGRGGKRRRGERSLVAAALSKIGAGVVLLVREVGVALLLCFYSGRRDMCVCCLCFAGGSTLSKSDASPQYTISGVSTMTTADSAVRISWKLTYYLLVVIICLRIFFCSSHLLSSHHSRAPSQ